MAITPTKFNNFVDKLSKAAINLNTAVYKIMLTNTVPVTATNALYSDVSGTELASGNGYTTGGATVPSTSATNSSGTESINGSAVTWTAGPSNMGPFEYFILYDSTSGVLVEWWDYGSAVTLNGGNADTMTATPSGSVVLQLGP